MGLLISGSVVAQFLLPISGSATAKFLSADFLIGNGAVLGENRNKNQPKDNPKGG